MTRVLLVNATRLGELPLEAFCFALGAEPDLEPDPFAAYDCLEINRLDFVLVELVTDLTHDRADGYARRPVNLNLGRTSEHQLFTPFPRSTAKRAQPYYLRPVQTAPGLSGCRYHRSSPVTGPVFRVVKGPIGSEDSPGVIRDNLNKCQTDPSWNQVLKSYFLAN